MNKRFPLKLSLLSAACLAATLVTSNAQAGVIEADLQQAMQSGGDVRFIVQFADQVDLRSFPGKGKGKGVKLASMLWALRSQADASQADTVELLKGKGAKRLIKLWSINGLAATASPDAVQAIAGLSGVKNIKLDATLTAPSAQLAAASTPEWNLNSIRATDLWSSGYDGTGTVVANMDSGVDVDHPDLTASWRDGDNSWFDPNGEHLTPYDRTGHGTQTMSLMVGSDSGGTGIGVSPGAQWIAVKIFNDAGVAYLSGIHQGFQWLLDPDGNPATNDIPDVVNNSWGFSNLVGQCYTEFSADIEALKAAGIAVVFSGGNQGSLGSVSPANNPGSFAVGAVDSSNQVTATSSRGPSACDGSFFPEVVAPGVSVKAADLTIGGVFPDSYVTVSGTSFAAPHVAGTMALLRQANPATSVAELEQALTDSAVDLGLLGPDDEYGYGMIDAVAANDLLTSAPGPICTDADRDGFFAEDGCGSELDCSDNDATINPAACDIKRDGIDQNCDGVDRRRGKSCPVPVVDPGDTNAPVINMLGDNPVNIELGAAYVDAGATAVDDIDGQVAVTTDNLVNTALQGTYSVTYTATDAAGNTAMSTRTVKVTAIVEPPIEPPTSVAPIAVADTATVKKNTTAFINLTGNDTDADGDLKDGSGNVAPGQINITSGSKSTRGGSVTIVTNGVNYKPKRNFRGTDTFSYTVTDLAGVESNEVTVSVSVVK